jgi:hypothetical protein
MAAMLAFGKRAAMQFNENFRRIIWLGHERFLLIKILEFHARRAFAGS